MSKISHIRLPNGTSYDIKDSNASQTTTLTQDEYDALSQAEKENGAVYFVTDGEPEYTIINDSVPIGAIQAYSGIVSPYGWLFCDGSAVSRETYSELFAVVGTTYGSGDGSTTFNLPDLRGRTLVGVGNSGATGSTNHTLGQKDGEEKHTLTVNEMPSHGHTVVWAGTYRMSLNQAGSTGYQVAWNSGAGIGDIATTNTGSDQSHNNMQPYTVANYIIKAFNTVSSSMLKQLDPQSIIFDALYPVGSYYETSDSTFDPNTQWSGTWVLETAGQVHVSAGTGYAVGATGGEATHILTVNEMPSHAHKIRLEYGTNTNLNTGVPGQYNQITNNSNYGQINTNQVESVGGGLAHNNMQPYIVVNRWHRTA